jgi:hypothetical protein
LKATEKWRAISLGDNIYPRGLDGSKDAELKLLYSTSYPQRF